MEKTDIDNSYLALLFDDTVYITGSESIESKSLVKENPINKSENTDKIVVFATHDLNSVFEDNLQKCFQRLNIKPENISRTKSSTEINNKSKCIIFSNEKINSSVFPLQKYHVENNQIWFDSFETISNDTTLKKVFWEKFQQFLTE